MPIETMYGVSCDECGDPLFENQIHAWPSPKAAVAAADRQGWDTDDEGVILCQSCSFGGEDLR